MTNQSKGGCCREVEVCPYSDVDMTGKEHCSKEEVCEYYEPSPTKRRDDEC
jgi:hypothetical protein